MECVGGFSWGYAQGLEEEVYLLEVSRFRKFPKRETIRLCMYPDSVKEGPLALLAN